MINFQKSKYFFLCLICLLFFTACTTSKRMLDLSIVSTNKISLNKAELASMPKTKGVVGKDVRYTVGFIPWSGVPHLDEAVKDALEKGSGDLMTDVSVYTKSTIWFLFIASIIANSIEVEGTVVKTNNN